VTRAGNTWPGDHAEPGSAKAETEGEKEMNMTTVLIEVSALIAALYTMLAIVNPALGAF
jgi:hypothetical protein